uniref:Uncharacterized protein n=1 Tax=Amphimedon queenslandica TaxID=400682 RepID=A0A1X7VEY5_AMPQE
QRVRKGGSCHYQIWILFVACTTHRRLQDLTTSRAWVWHRKWVGRVKTTTWC